MKIIPYVLLLLVLNISCVTDVEQTGDEDLELTIEASHFRTQHIKSHNEHIDLINSQEEIIFSSFEHILDLLADTSEVRYIMDQWHVTNNFSDELYHKSQVYISDCIATDSTSNNITNMRSSCVPIYNVFVLNSTEFKVAVEIGYYTDAVAIIEAMKIEMKAAITELRQNAIAYLLGIQ